jgi:hypothetical protein
MREDIVPIPHMSLYHGAHLSPLLLTIVTG